MTWTRERHHEEQGPLMRRVRNLIRRAVVHASLGGLWQVEGYGGERMSAVEAFSGIGFVSRPRTDSDPEVIVARVGSASGHPVIIASRDRSIEIELAEGETAMVNGTGAKIKLTKEGDIEVSPKYGGRVYVRDDGGDAQPLVTRADLLNHGHASFGAAPTEIVPTPAPAEPFPGTQSLRAK